MDMNKLLDVALKQDASDIHCTVGRPPSFRVSGGLDDDLFGVGFIWDQTEADSDVNVVPGSGFTDEVSGWVISARYNPVQQLAVKLQFGNSETRYLGFGDNDDREIESATFGVDYHLGDQTKLYSYYTENEADGSGPTLTGEDESEFNVLALGLEHRF